MVTLYGHTNPYIERLQLRKDFGEEQFDDRTGLKNLSLARANLILNYLVQNGIEKERLACFGLKGTKPISKTNLEINRRVEVVLKSVKIRDKSKEWEQILERSKKEEELQQSKFNLIAIAALDTIYFKDQDLRNKISELESKYGAQSENMNNLWKEIEKADAGNIKVVSDLIEKYGWLGRSSVGYRGEITVFLVIQHSSLQMQKKYYGQMVEAVKKNEANEVNLAYLKDRILICEGKKQIYGTQVLYNEKTKLHEIAPLSDPIHVNEKRRKLGLSSIEVYLKQFNP